MSASSVDAGSQELEVEMIGDAASNKPGYWDRAGEQGYGNAMYSSSFVESQLRGRAWQISLEIADKLGLPTDGYVLDFGCGDGAFANQVLSQRYRKVDGLDKSDVAINRAQSESRNGATFRAVDLITFDYDTLPRYDAAFLLGILHHVKSATPDIVKSLGRRTDKMIVLEPNGNHLVRKVLEFTPSYRDAGEDSFRSKDLMALFSNAGWRTAIWRRVNLFPNFTPAFIYRLLKPIEPMIEQNSFWNALCTVDMYGLTRK
jgi:2-polyprenyl-3-methyl-5-hydroxy-6-metoxy-1,4-benzoquinol methylase